MRTILVIGGGVSGLVSGFALSQHSDVRVHIIESGQPGGEFLAGGLKYIHRSDGSLDLLNNLGQVFTNYFIQGGILLHGKVEPYPTALHTLGRERSQRIQDDHYRKTRKTEPGPHSARAMNDPESTGPKRSLQCDLVELVHNLLNRTSIIRERAIRIRQNVVYCASGASYSYNNLVVTIPLWVAQSLFSGWIDIAPAMAMKLNLVQIDPASDEYAKWDYVYTPYTPENLIHRISANMGGYSCEFNGNWDEDETNRLLTGDLNYLFPGGWALSGVRKGLNGHLLPMDERPKWPENVAPLGRFAQWESRATVDQVYSNALKLASNWGLKRRSEYDRSSE